MSNSSKTPFTHHAKPGQYALRKALGLIFALVVLIVGAPLAHACSRTTNLGDISVSLPTTITVPANAAVGTVIASVTVPVTGASSGLNFASCGAADNDLYWAIKAGGVVANRVGSTGVAGVGYTTSLSGGGLSAPVVMDSFFMASVFGNSATAPSFTSQLFLTVNLVVTGPITPGAIALNPSGSYGLPNVLGVFYVGNGGVSLFRAVVPANQSSITVSSCTVNTKALSVTLAQANTASLASVGATAGAQTVTLNLTCPAGVNVNVTLTDASNPSNTTTTLGLAPGSTATGVGLQISNGDTPLAYGPDSPTAGNLNQWSAGTATGGAFNIPLKVSYVRTSTSMNPGTVNGVATFTMSYQ
jgi:type 1 fimbria pilin